MKPKIIYITGFRQHAGKTVTSLGLLHLLKQIYKPEELGYIKPVGQELEILPDGRRVDKDARIIEKFSGIPDLDMNFVSPVRLGSGFTRDFLDSNDQEGQTFQLSKDIEEALASMSHKKVIVAEGTGHPGVGGIVGLSNAGVSNLIGADVLFLSGGGIGKALDMLEVDLTYFMYKKCNVRGIIFNKLIPDKIDTVKKYLSEELLQKKYPHFNSPLAVYGYLPHIDELQNPSMALLSRKFKNCEILGEPDNSAWHKPLNRVKIISLKSENLNVERYFRNGDVVILGAGSVGRIGKIIQAVKSGAFSPGGIIFSCGDTMTLRQETRDYIDETRIPALFVQEDTSGAEERIHSIYENTKIQLYDTEKNNAITRMFETYFDMDRFTTHFLGK